MKPLKTLRKPLLLLLVLPLVAGCVYRAPMEQTVVTEDPARFTSVSPAYRDLAALITSDTGMPPTDGNTLSLFPEAQQKFDVLLADLRDAKASIYIEHYRFRMDTIGTCVAQILQEKAGAGLDIRVIVDRGASIKEDREKLTKLQDYGITSYLYYRPRFFRDLVWPSKGAHRDHRKIVLVDGQTGYLGGRNIQDKYFGWRDCDIRISGPAVADLGEVFMEAQRQLAPQLPALKITAETVCKAVDDTIPGLQAFRGKTVQIIPDSPWEKVLPIRNCYEWAIQHAKDYFYFYNPYTPPPASTLKALKEAVLRGVDVRWIVPANNDVKQAKWLGESLYKELLEAGVKIYEWQGNVLHTKQFISDDYLTAIGSANMDNMSFFLNMEVHALVYDEELAVSARQLFEKETTECCLQISLDEVRDWGSWRRFRNWFTRTFFGRIG